mmetsp:Transcript_30696/g.91904  ORF Transcript_30696/g.91904 Transcript_30696/m.91904 type:complete len:224 (-) Transcript_30696:742-1413(-)
MFVRGVGLARVSGFFAGAGRRSVLLRRIIIGGQSSFFRFVRIGAVISARLIPVLLFLPRGIVRPGRRIRRVARSVVSPRFSCGGGGRNILLTDAPSGVGAHQGRCVVVVVGGGGIARGIQHALASACIVGGLAIGGGVRQGARRGPRLGGYNSLAVRVSLIPPRLCSVFAKVPAAILLFVVFFFVFFLLLLPDPLLVKSLRHGRTVNLDLRHGAIMLGPVVRQ